MPRADGPFRVLEKVNDNAYKLNFPEGFNVSPTLNSCDLSPYLKDGIGVKDGANLRANPFQRGRMIWHIIMELEKRSLSQKT